MSHNERFVGHSGGQLILQLMELHCERVQLQWWLAGVGPASLKTAFCSGMRFVFGHSHGCAGNDCCS